MATYNIYNNSNLSPGGFFPVGIAIEKTNLGGTGRDYIFTLGEETRIVRVYWHPETSNIYAIGLYLADADPHNGDEEPLGEINDISIPLNEFENIWFQEAPTASAASRKRS